MIHYDKTFYNPNTHASFFHVIIKQLQNLNYDYFLIKRSTSSKLSLTYCRFWPSVVCYLTKWDLINQISLNSRNYKLKFGIRLTLKHLAKIKYSLKNHQLKLKLDKLLVNIIVLRWPKTSKWFLSKRNDLIKWR